LFVVIGLFPFSRFYDFGQSFYLSAERQLEILNARKKLHLGMWMQAVTSPVELRAYPNNPLYCGRLQSPMPALSTKNVLNVEKTTPPSIFGLPPWPRTFRSAS